MKKARILVCILMALMFAMPSTLGALAAGTDTSEFNINWFVDLSWWKWGGLEWGQDVVSRIIKEKTGANITFIVPASDDGTQLATMIASDTLPDVITINAWWSSTNRALTNKMAAEGLILPMNDLIDKYAPEAWKVIRPDVFSWYAEGDGKTYLLPNYAYSNMDLAAGEQLVPNGCFTVRKDLWEAIGSPDMSTAEGLLAACQKVKDEVGTYNGQDIIPIQLYEGVGNSIGWLSEYFATPYESADGQYLYDFLQPQYKEALKFLNTAYKMGYISDANFSDNRDLINEKIASGRVFVQFTACQDFSPAMQSLYDLDPNAVYVPFVLRNSAGDDPVLMDIRGMGWLNTAITKNAKQPDRIIKLFEYLISDEGQIANAYGEEGVNWNWTADGKIEQTEATKADIAAGNATKYGLGSLMMLDNWALRRKWVAPETNPKILATVDTYVKIPMAQYSFDYSAAGLKIDPTDPRVADMQEVSAKINNIRVPYIAQMVVAADDAAFEALYNNAIADMKAAGLDNLLVFNNDGFQNAKKALGIEFSWHPLVK
jgi:putative aldouronate transport system substrate-binding protein